MSDNTKRRFNGILFGMVAVAMTVSGVTANALAAGDGGADTALSSTDTASPADPNGLTSLDETYVGNPLTFTESVQYGQATQGCTKVIRLSVTGLADTGLQESINTRFQAMQDEIGGFTYADAQGSPVDSTASDAQLVTCTSGEWEATDWQPTVAGVVAANFSNVLSLGTYVYDTNPDTTGVAIQQALNVRLDTGEDLVPSDLFTATADLADMITTQARNADPTCDETCADQMVNAYLADPTQGFYFTENSAIVAGVAIPFESYWQQVAIFTKYADAAGLYDQPASVSCPVISTHWDSTYQACLPADYTVTQLGFQAVDWNANSTSVIVPIPADQKWFVVSENICQQFGMPSPDPVEGIEPTSGMGLTSVTVSLSPNESKASAGRSLCIMAVDADHLVTQFGWLDIVQDEMPDTQIITVDDPEDGAVVTTATPTISGTVTDEDGAPQRGQFVTLDDGVNPAYTTVTDDQGQWSVALSAPLATGENTIWIDSSSNEDSTGAWGTTVLTVIVQPSGPVTVTLEKEYAVGLELGGVSQGAAAVVSAADADGAPVDGLTVTFTSEGSAVLLNAASCVTGNGIWSVLDVVHPSQPGMCGVAYSGVQAGTATIHAYYQDAEVEGSPVTVTVSGLAAPPAPRVTTANATVISGHSDGSPGSPVANDIASVEVTYPAANTTTKVVTAQVNGFGDWSLTTPADAVNGKINVVSITTAGVRSQSAQVDLDVVAPDAPVVRVATMTQFAGEAEKGSWIRVTGAVTAGNTTDNDGNWLIIVPDTATPGEVSVTATDMAGNESEPTVITLGAETASTESVVVALLHVPVNGMGFIIVSSTSADGSPVDGVAVDFTVEGEAAFMLGNTCTTGVGQMLQLSDPITQGPAQPGMCMAIYASTQAGNAIVHASSGGVELEGSPLAVTAYNIPDPDQSTLTVSGDHISVVNDPCGDEPTVHTVTATATVVDATGDPVAGAIVSFTADAPLTIVDSGAGAGSAIAVPPGTSPSALVPGLTVTDSNGVAKAEVSVDTLANLVPGQTAGIHAEVMNNQMSTDEISGSPADVQVAIATPDLAPGTLVVETSQAGSPQGAWTVTATALDSCDVAHEGVDVQFAVTGNAVLSASSDTTDSHGQASVVVTDTAQETVTVSAAAESFGTGTADITFGEQPISSPTSSVATSSPAQTSSSTATVTSSVTPSVSSSPTVTTASSPAQTVTSNPTQSVTTSPTATQTLPVTSSPTQNVTSTPTQTVTSTQSVQPSETVTMGPATQTTTSSPATAPTETLTSTPTQIVTQTSSPAVTVTSSTQTSNSAQTTTSSPVVTPTELVTSSPIEAQTSTTSPVTESPTSSPAQIVTSSQIPTSAPGSLDSSTAPVSGPGSAGTGGAGQAPTGGTSVPTTPVVLFAVLSLLLGCLTIIPVRRLMRPVR